MKSDSARMRWHTRWYSDSHFISRRITCCFALLHSSLKNLWSRKVFFLKVPVNIFITLESWIIFDFLEWVIWIVTDWLSNAAVIRSRRMTLTRMHCRWIGAARNLTQDISSPSFLPWPVSNAPTTPSSPLQCSLPILLSMRLEIKRDLLQRIKKLRGEEHWGGSWVVPTAEERFFSSIFLIWRKIVVRCKEDGGVIMVQLSYLYIGRGQSVPPSSGPSHVDFITERKEIMLLLCEEVTRQTSSFVSSHSR